MMAKETKTGGTWSSRVFIGLLTVVLAILVFWLLVFLVEDIESSKGPQYVEVERKHLDPSLVQKKEQVEKQIADLERDISKKGT